MFLLTSFRRYLKRQEVSLAKFRVASGEGVKRVEGPRKTAGRATRKRQANRQHLAYSSFIYYLIFSLV
jgi:hypothetical protein